ncbi:AAA family ATPase [Peptoniphilus catoniae]|uniref:cytidylate kinase-like family protein n=1 Tax=Peptoniphilus catoniae TaxID=1660341 RepID=UPI0010FDAB83|nr:cytidylate kinase-like family protein [Peptoniphilus catoniae]
MGKNILSILFEKKSDINIIFTIDGEHGSGASKIAEIIGKKLGIKVYDEDIIELKTLEAKIDPDKVTKDDSFLKGTVYDLYRENYSYSQEDILENDASFLAHSKTIRKLASDGPCVIVGKCGNYVLKDQFKTLDAFITAKADYRIKEIMKRDEVDEEKALSQIQKIDTRRSNHYKRYANGHWAESSEYDITINSAKFTYEEIADLLIDAARLIR